MVLDQIKSVNGDSFVTEDHVIYLANVYRDFLLEQKRLKDLFYSFTQDNEQTLCIDLERKAAMPDMDCNEIRLRSVQEIPNTMLNTQLHVYPFDYFYVKNIAFVSRDRFKFVGYNKYMRNIIYCTLGIDNHLYLKSNNPQFLYLKKLKVSGIFEDSDKAKDLVCCDDGSTCDVLDQTFPLQGDLIPQLIEFLVKELSGVLWRQSDKQNNSNDDIDDIMRYLQLNTKSSLQKQLEE